MVRRKKRDRPERHKQSLTEQLADPQEQGVRTKPRTKRQKNDGNDDDQALDAKTSARIMREARQQQEDIEAEGNVLLQSTRDQDSASALLNAEMSDSDSDSGGTGLVPSEIGGWGDDIDVSPEDEAAVAAFLNPGASRQRTLADIILERFEEKEKAQTAQGSRGDEATAGPGEIDVKVQAVYKGVGQILKRYTAGKVPKALKIVPRLQNWEEILYLTEPDEWSPHAVFQATRMFVSNMNARLAQRFLALVLLPHVREDIGKNKRLHFALFQALRKAAFKPDAFYKGVLLPLCRSGDCTLREAVILSSAISRVSIPVAHSGAALLRLAEMPYAGTTSFFIRVLLDKKYALPYRVVDALVDHFLRFKQEERTLPVVWHQSLLVFVQRYKHEIRKEDQALLRKLLKMQYHYKVTPEISRELDAARARGEKQVADAAMRPVSVVSAKGLEDPKALPPVIMMDED